MKLDLYTEIFEIIDSCTFAAKSISLTMWQAFELMHKTFKAGAELYLEGGSTPLLLLTSGSQVSRYAARFRKLHSVRP